MTEPVILSRPYPTRDDAAIAGFKKVMQNSQAWKTREFAFWVVLKPNASQRADYFYTQPVSDDSGSEVTAEWPRHQIVRAHCHTHPSRISTGNFSPGDKRMFMALRKDKPGVAWYLLNPQGEIRVADAECEFPAGKSVRLRDDVKP